MARRVIVVGVMASILAAGAWAADTAGGARALDKKLIEYGWDVPFADYVEANIRAMEKRPFDGLIFKLRGGGRALVPWAWKTAKFEKDFEACKNIQWGRFTDNFVVLWAASDQDWFNDEHWKAIEHNVGIVAKAARLARCVGVCWDPEPYGTNPWSYAKAQHRDTKSFAEYEAMARRRGAQFVRSIQGELPKAQILTFFQLSVMGRLLKPMDPKERAGNLSQAGYALLPAFLNGMLDAAKPDVRIIDGNEPAYYYTDSRQHLAVAHTIAQRGLLLIDPKLWPAYRQHVRVGQALYIDQYFGLRARKVLGHHMTAAERRKWFEHNVYWAMYTSDKYVWCYSEKMNWWKNRGVPPGCEEAIHSAKAKLAAGKPLGFDIKPIVERVRERQRAEIRSRLKMRTATIHRMADNVAKPKIDGDLAEWTPKAKMAPLLPLAAAAQRKPAPTQAWVTYDAQALYVAFRCTEPNPKKMSIRGEKHDQDVWLGDDVEVQVSVPGKTTPFYHFMVNPRGVTWDAIHGPSSDLTYNPTWQAATRVGADHWTAEMAIPWAAMKMTAPKPGTKLRANLCRQRRQGSELSAWSVMTQGFLEHDLFGTWVFK